MRSCVGGHLSSWMFTLPHTLVDLNLLRRLGIDSVVVNESSNSQYRCVDLVPNYDDMMYGVPRLPARNRLTVDR